MNAQQKSSAELASLVTAELRKLPGFEAFGFVRVYGNPHRVASDGINWSISTVNKGDCELEPDKIISALSCVRARLGKQYRVIH